MVEWPSEILTKKEINLIVKSINDSKQQYNQWNAKRNLGFENGKYLDRWNYIFANLKNAFSESPFLTYHVPRGKLWEFLIIYNTDSKFMYLLMREDTFRNIRRQKDRAYHYIRVLNSKNFNLQDEKIQKINFFSGFEDISFEYLDEDLERMIKEIKDEVKGCANILYSENADGVKKISANFANYELDIFKSYDLTKYITANVDDIIDTKVDVATVQPVIPLSIRADKLKEKKILNDETKKQENETKD